MSRKLLAHAAITGALTRPLPWRPTFAPKRFGIGPRRVGNEMAALILVVDDDPVQRRLLEAMIRSFGYESETVEPGETALARLPANDRPAIDLVILDLVMPDLDGMG